MAYRARLAHAFARPKREKKPALEAFTKIIFLDITGSRLCVRAYPIKGLDELRKHYLSTPSNL